MRGPSYQLALNINFKDVTALISDIIFCYQLACSGSPLQCSTFSSIGVEALEVRVVSNN